MHMCINFLMCSFIIRSAVTPDDAAEKNPVASSKLPKMRHKNIYLGLSFMKKTGDVSNAP